jgi:hypothetical protein
MTAQSHIDAIGASQIRTEKLTRKLLKLAQQMKAEADTHHALLHKAETDFLATQPAGNVVAFSGGMDKPPPPPDPDAPVGPPFGG